MFKQIPESDISIRDFNVYKEWTITQNDYPMITASTGSGFFDPDTATKVEGVYTSSLYSSIKSKYYSFEGNVINQYGIIRNPYEYATQRPLTDTIRVIDIPQLKYGEEIKRGSIVLTDTDNSRTFNDDGYGAILTEIPTYYLISYDVDNQELVFEVEEVQYTVTLSYLDLTSGQGIFTYDGDTDSYTVFLIDFDTAIMTLAEPLNLSGIDEAQRVQGNVFYDDGLIVLTNAPDFTNYELSYKSVQSIYETEVLITANKGEFNHSQNPTAVDVVLRDEYEFTTTPIRNVVPEETVTIKNVLDISQKQSFHGTVGSATGSWGDFYEYENTDPTGSYLSTYVTTIGLYDEQENMVAIAKLPKPIKKLPNYNVSFLIRIDT